MLRSRLTVILAALWMAGCAAPGGHPPAGSDNPQAGAGCAQPARPAVATDPATAQPLRAQVWACTDRRTVVTYPQPDRLRVVDRGCQRELPPVVSALSNAVPRTVMTSFASRLSTVAIALPA